MLADKYHGDLIKAFLNIHNYTISDFVIDCKKSNKPNHRIAVTKEIVKPTIDHTVKKPDTEKPDSCSKTSNRDKDERRSDRRDSRKEEERKDKKPEDNGKPSSSSSRKSSSLTKPTKPKNNYQKDELDPEFDEIPDKHKYRKYSFNEMYDLLRGNRAVYNTLERERARYVLSFFNMFNFQ